MSGFAFRSINSVLSFVMSIVLLAGIVVLVVFVAKSSHDLMFNTSISGMKTIDAGIVTSINDLIDVNLSMVRVAAGSHDAKQALAGDPRLMDNQIRALMKVYKGLNSIFVLNKDGVVVTGITSAGESFAGASYADRPYFSTTMKGEDAVEPEIVVGKKTGNQVFVIAAPIRNDAGTVIGLAAVTVDWLDYVTKHVLNIKVADNGYAYIIDANGRFIAHPSKDKLMTNASSQGFIKQSLQQKQGVLSYSFDGEEKVQVFDTVKRTGWLVCVSAFESDLTKAAAAQRNTLVTIAAGIFLVLLGCTVFVLRRLVVSPLRSIMDYSAQITHGNFKATLRNDFRYELGELAHNFQETTQALKNRLGFANGVLEGVTFPLLITDTDVNAIYINEAMVKLIGLPGAPKDYIGQSGAQLFYGDPARKTINHTCLETGTNALGIETEFTFKGGAHRYLRIDASLIRDLDGNVVGAITLVADLTEIKLQQRQIESQHEATAEVARNANAISDRLSAATEELSAQIEQSSRGAEIQAQRVSETATAMEEMNASVLEVARNAAGAADTSDNAKARAENGATVVNQVVEGIANLRRQALDLKENMGALGQQAQGIGQIMNVISDIADQTNLLALNAAIEAARAGDAGRGFAVVADEVRKLAEKTMNATKEVGSAIQGIQDGATRNAAHVDQTVGAIEETTSLANASGKALDEIVSLVEQAADQARSIATAAEQQSSTSEEMNRNVEQINTISAETSAAMAQSASAVSELASQAQELKHLIAQLSSGGSDESRQTPRALAAR